jgi:hydroxypyruvate isomerase
MSNEISAEAELMDESRGWGEQQYLAALAAKDAEIERLRAALESADTDQRQAVREAIGLRDARWAEQLQSDEAVEVGFNASTSETVVRDEIRAILAAVLEEHSLSVWGRRDV